MALVQVTFPSCRLQRSVTFQALIPTDRDFRPGQLTTFTQEKFRTLYLLHGYTGDHHDFLLSTDIWMMSAMLGLAIILPSGENSFYLEDEDLGTSHSAFVGQELVDFTRSLFPLSSRREDTYIGGNSMGGYGALINGLRYAGTFSKILSLSGALIEVDIADRKATIPDGVSNDAFQRRMFGDPAGLRHSDKDPRHLIEGLQASRAPIPEISLCCGENDFLLGCNRKLHNDLTAMDVPHHYEEGAGEHNWDYWLPRLQDWIKDKR